MSISETTDTLVKMVPVAVGVGLLDRASRLAEQRRKARKIRLKSPKDRESKELKVKEVSKKKLHDYLGMNPRAAKVMGVKPPIHNIQLLKGQSPKLERQTMAHELVEMSDMEEGKSYWQAHEHALKAEKKGLQILKTHDDGDLTVKAGGRTFLVATDKTVFRKIGTHHRHKINHAEGRLRSVKYGPLYHTKTKGGTLLSRFPLERRRRRRTNR